MDHPRTILQRNGLRPKRSLGQNFLVDENILDRIASSADITSNDNVLEIGPGLGSLTEKLARVAGQVVAIEIDSTLIPILDENLSQFMNIKLINKDALEINPSHHFSGSFKVVANTPYYISTAIIRHLLSGDDKPSMLVLTLQKEVAQRAVAGPGKMSLLSVATQFYAKAAILFTIKAGSFWPRPEIDSAVLRLIVEPFDKYKIVDESAFFAIVRAGFSQKRKQLKNNLSHLGYSTVQIKDLLQQANIDGKRRAETLSVEEWVKIYRAFHTEFRQLS
jgi:16S rRNA (adenine1518-N6/adenine1519-N6)-dimethyltransferase